MSDVYSPLCEEGILLWIDSVFIPKGDAGRSCATSAARYLNGKGDVERRRSMSANQYAR